MWAEFLLLLFKSDFRTVVLELQVYWFDSHFLLALCLEEMGDKTLSMCSCPTTRNLCLFSHELFQSNLSCFLSLFCFRQGQGYCVVYFLYKDNFTCYQKQLKFSPS